MPFSIKIYHLSHWKCLVFIYEFLGNILPYGMGMVVVVRQGAGFFFKMLMIGLVQLWNYDFFFGIWDLHYDLVHDHLVGRAVNVPVGYRILHMFIKLDLFCSTCLIFSNFLSAYTINNWKKYVISPPFFFTNSILFLDYTYQYMLIYIDYIIFSFKIEV